MDVTPAGARQPVFADHEVDGGLAAGQSLSMASSRWRVCDWRGEAAISKYAKSESAMIASSRWRIREGRARDDCMSAMNEFAIGETMLARLLHVVPECSDSVIMTIPLRASPRAWKVRKGESALTSWRARSSR